MTDSILETTKKMLGVDESYDVFDPDIIMHINSVFVVLNQLGVGPSKCFSISDETTTWAEFFSNEEVLEMVKTYMYMKVKLIFDPPISSVVMQAAKETIAELEWRMNVFVDPGEETDYE